MNTAANVSKADILKATIIASTTLEFMAKKAGVEGSVILKEIMDNPEGNTAQYFKTLTSSVL